MQAVLMGNITDAIMRAMVSAVPYAEEQILRACIEEVVPEKGIIIEATEEELRDNKDLGGILYNNVIVKRKEIPNAN